MLSAINIHYPGSNFVSREYLDPLIMRLLASLGLDGVQLLYSGCQFAIFFLGMLYLYYSHVPKQKGRNRLLCAFLWAMVGLLALSSCVGSDPFFLKTHWLPFLVGSLLRLRCRPSVVGFLFSLLFSCLWCLNAGALAPLGVVLISFGVYWLGSEDVPRDVIFDARKKGSWCFPFIVLTSFICATAFYPIYSMPNYPAGARLAPISVLTFEVRPLLSPWLEPNPVVYAELALLISQFAWRFILLAIAFVGLELLRSAWLRFQASRSYENLLPKPAVGSVVVMFLGVAMLAPECLLAEEYRFWTPFQLLRYVMPGMGLVMFPWILSPIALTLAFAGSMRRSRILFPGVLFWLLFVFRSTGIYAGPTEHINHFAIFANKPAKAAPASMHHSPSAYLVKTQGEWTAVPGVRKARSYKRLERISRQEISSVDAQPMPNEAKLAIDGKDKTRWRTSGPQKSGEYFIVKFHQPTDIIKVVLSARKTPSDFPRGISVEGSLDGENFWKIVKQDTWLGPIKWAVGEYPYFGPQSEVVVDFPSEQKVSLLRFTQLGRTKTFDWSIGELKLFQTQKNNIKPK